ncbi:hypothetical protein ACWXWB_10725 [Pantoea dispersa]|uniref:hypothetical protein n=1 Tax=Pantoea dispersa TaxID=59814 RepID=UPI002DBD67FE|nr:hypothetical protein [Pantoea dispersa]MEB5972155.1 hypothetical protein [Pantoea dispersa]
MAELELSAGGFQNVLDNNSKNDNFYNKIKHLNKKAAFALRFLPFPLRAQAIRARDCGKTRQNSQHLVKNSAIRQRN